MFLTLIKILPLSFFVLTSIIGLYALPSTFSFCFFIHYCKSTRIVNFHFHTNPKSISYFILTKKVKHKDFLCLTFLKESIAFYLRTLTGYDGVFICFGGLAFNCSITISIAFSNCGSLPFITSAGHCSTSISGGVPTFSMPNPFSS